MRTALYIQVQNFSMVPSVGAVLVSDHAPDKAILQDASSIVTEKPKNSLYTYFTYQTNQSSNIPLKSFKIWKNNPTNEKKWLILLSSQKRSLTCFSLLCLSKTHKSFLHACTPERRTRVYAHLFIQREHVQAPDTTKHILQKNIQDAETLGNDASGGASEPHRLKYMRLHSCCILFIALGGFSHGKHGPYPWCLS